MLSTRAGRLFFGMALSAAIGAHARAEPIPVNKREGVVHGFLVLRSLQGEVLAEGDLVQVPKPERIESRLVFRFRDGSVHDERLVFSQDRLFRLERYHLLQKGPSFPQPLEATLEREENRYRVRHVPEEEKEAEVLEGHLELPPDVYNGMFFTLLKNVDPDSGKKVVSMVAFTPEPRVVNLEITAQGEERFSTVEASRRAVHYLLDIEVTGFAGFLAKLFGKDPPPLHTWMLGGDAPTFVRFRGFLYPGGPVWSIELASPTFRSDTTARAAPE